MADDNKAPLSFNFKRKSDSLKLAASKLKDESTEEATKDVDYIRNVEDNKINGTFKKPKKKELVIPLINRNRWRLPDASVSNEGQVNEGSQHLETLAAEEIIKETREASEDWDNRGNPVSSKLEIPLFMQNRVPSGYETDSKVDVTLRAEQSTLEDYEAIPVDGYGRAMLRGMGWKEEEGIGLSRKGVVAPLEVSLRPKGLGLGADLSFLEKATKELTEARSGTEKLSIVTGAFVKIISGKHQGSYGQIDGLDENNGRAFVRLAIGNSNVIALSEFFLKPVTAKEYKDSSRVLNKEKYDEYKAKQDQENAKQEDRKKDGSSKKKKRRRSRSRSSSRERKSDRKSEKKSTSADKRKRDARDEAWLHPLLRVRCIDSKFKEGKYFKEKMIVVDVISEKHCICKTESGKLLDKISTSKLETVIPRTDPAYVMVVNGRRKTQIGQIIERNKERCIATIQILPDRDEIFQVGYDDICEYTGDVRNLC